jgi:hypothetical protein
MGTFDAIPYATKQAIIFVQQGLLEREQGILPVEFEVVPEMADVADVSIKAARARLGAVPASPCSSAARSDRRRHRLEARRLIFSRGVEPQLRGYFATGW